MELPPPETRGPTITTRAELQWVVANGSDVTGALSAVDLRSMDTHVLQTRVCRSGGSKAAASGDELRTL